MRRACSPRRRARLLEQAFELEARLGEMTELAPHARLPGAGAAGGIGAALAYLGAQLVSGAELVLDLLGFEPSGYDLVVTGRGNRGRHDAIAARLLESSPDAAAERGVRCVDLRRDRRRTRSRTLRPSR